MARSRSRSRNRRGGWRGRGGFRGRRGGLSAFERGRRYQQSIDDRARSASRPRGRDHSDADLEVSPDRDDSRGRSRVRSGSMDRISKAVRTLPLVGGSGSAWGDHVIHRHDIELAGNSYEVKVGGANSRAYRDNWTVREDLFPGWDALKDPVVVGVSFHIDFKGNQADLRGTLDLFVGPYSMTKGKDPATIAGHYHSSFTRFNSPYNIVIPEGKGVIKLDASGGYSPDSLEVVTKWTVRMKDAEKDDLMFSYSVSLTVNCLV